MQADFPNIGRAMRLFRLSSVPAVASAITRQGTSLPQMRSIAWCASRRMADRSGPAPAGEEEELAQARFREGLAAAWSTAFSSALPP